MVDKLNTKKVAYSLATVSGIAYIVCALLVAVAPEGTLSFFGALFHGIDITKIAATNLTIGSTILGFVEIIVLSYLLGWLFAITYNKLR